ncbi:hypothetical protein [Xanthocytophaga flava]|uniref:hypothetical protein n=1 Tax=Xanthocytophaga flava TaxID=3048013 RepID=UPI0028D83767|nr:hypothetical protein [Xanthocytophaga flavus]
MGRCICVTLWSFCFIVTCAFSQDVIYTSNGSVITGKITGLDGDKIKYAMPKNPGPAYSIDVTDVLVAFNQNGNVITFPIKDGKSEITGFLNPPTHKSHDILVKMDNSVIECENVSLGKKDVRFQKLDAKKGKEEKISREDVAVILYKDGHHEFGVNPAQATVPIRMAKTQIDQLTGVGQNIHLKEEANANKGESTRTTTTDIHDEMAFPGGPEEFESFRQKAISKVDEFGRYIATIVDPRTPADQSNSTIDLAFTLFVNADVRVEVSNVNTGSKNKYKIKDYLKRLKLKGADYQEVDVSYADIGYASEFIKGPDGNYYGVVSFVQTFKGFVDGKVVYGDITQRNITVILKLYEKVVEGQGKKMWDVFLADVGIIETRKL